jgi:hypothetical protein
MTDPTRSSIHGKAGKSTREMEGKRLGTVAIILLAMLLALILYSRHLKAITSLGLPAVLVIVGLFVYLMKQGEKKGIRTLKRARDAERGAVAEEKTGDFLEGLPEGYFVLHDFNVGRGNVDHILVGPKGVLTLEVKSHRGSVTFDGTDLFRDGKLFEKDFLKQAWSECFAVREILAARGLVEVPVEPVILFTNAFVQLRGKAKGVEVVSLKFLPKFLERLPDRLAPLDVKRTFGRLRASTVHSA